MEDQVDEPAENSTFRVTVVRDPNFARYTADSSLADQVGPEIEIIFLSVSRKLKEVEWRNGSTQPAGATRVPETTELCRVRMDTEAASNLSFNLLLALTQMGEVSLDALDNNVAMIKQHVGSSIDATAEQDSQ